MNGERAPKRLQRAFLIPQILEDDAQAGKRAHSSRREKNRGARHGPFAKYVLAVDSRRTEHETR